MALNLDPRQRAMLQDMGITIWWPQPAAPLPASTAAPSEALAVTAAAAPSAASMAVPHAAPVANTLVSAQVAAPSAPAVIAAPAPQPIAPAPAEAEPVPVEWHIAPAVQAYPTATGGRADDAWLVVWECANPSAPLEGESGKLLNNMLRALRLHHSPHVWIASMQRPGREALPVAGLPAAPVAWQDLAQGLPASVQHTQPARILLLGMHAARAALGSQEALGRLRAQVHQLHGIPTVVSYDPAYLLRSPHAKPAAWADLCRGHALRPPSAP